MQKALEQISQEIFENIELELSRHEQDLLLDIISRVSFERDIKEELKNIGMEEAHYEELVKAIKEKALAEKRITKEVINVSKESA